MNIPGSLTFLLLLFFTGMPLDHTIETGYFTVSKNVQHGDELICSYPACQSAGVKVSLLNSEIFYMPLCSNSHPSLVLFPV